MEKELTIEQLDAMRTILWGLYWISSDLRGGVRSEPSLADFLREVSPYVSDGYVEKKCAEWRASPTRYVGSLDPKRFEQFAAWVVRLKRERE